MSKRPGTDSSDDEESESVQQTSKRYKTLTQREHVLQRPAMYIGAISLVTKRHIVFWKENEETVCEFMDVTYSPALIQCFLEALVNAMDNAEGNPSQKNIKITVLQSGQLEVSNDGDTIPIEVQDEEYIPSTVFGKWLTGSNFDDDETKEKQQQFTGGQNGVGIKATNAWSCWFDLEVCNAKCKKRLTQTWRSNMLEVTPAKVTSYKNKKSLTTVRWMPDYNRLGMQDVTANGLDPCVYRLLCSHAYFACACCRGDMNVYLNSEKIPFKNPQFLLPKGSACVRDTVENSNGLVWSVTVAATADRAEARVLAFVNGIPCHSGGHVDHVHQKVLDICMSKIRKRTETVRPPKAKDCYHVVLVCRIPNPRFDSQSKNVLDTPYKQFGFKWEPSDAFRNSLEKSQILANIKELVDEQESKTTKRAEQNVRKGSTSHIKSYDAAQDIGKQCCTLLITEGESAKTLAVAGVSAIGRSRFGIYPLRGKLLNVRRVSYKKCLENREINDLVAIIGLNKSVTYTGESVSRLRYQNVAIFTDQDSDGSHIAGLIMNWLSAHYPSLLACTEFVYRMVTPIIKATDPVVRTSINFFTEVEFHRWKEALTVPCKEYKLYKGLGTSTAREAVSYFKDLDRHMIRIDFKEDENEAMNLFFAENSDVRKSFLLEEYSRHAYVDYNLQSTSVDSFLKHDMSHFSMADVERSIPSAIDGLKPTQRKVVHTFLRKNFRKEQKVFEACAAVAKYTRYHHGDMSMIETIVGMAQDHAGMNNIALLTPQGSFGDRLNKPSVHAKARYICTYMDPITDQIFRRSDEMVLDYYDDEGHQIEPHMFYPVIPMVLVNGAFGIATGWSCFVPNYNPEEVIRVCEQMARGETDISFGLVPWYQNYDGEIRMDESEDNVFHTFGHAFFDTENGERFITITELPVGRWSHDFVDWIREHHVCTKYSPSAKERLRFASEVRSQCSVYRVHIYVVVHQEAVQLLGESKILDLLKLKDTKKTTNMFLFDSQEKLRKFESIADIFKEFGEARLSTYEKRRLKQLDILNGEVELLENKRRYVLGIRDETIDFRWPRSQKNEFLASSSYQLCEDSYKYLTDMNASSFGDDEVAKLEAKILSVQGEIDELKNTNPSQMWIKELAELREAYATYSYTKQKIREEVEIGDKSASSFANSASGKKKVKKK